MIKLFNVNPFTEAMLYFFGRANNIGTKERLEKAAEKNPENKKILEKIVKPIINVEKMLNSNLSVDEILLEKYFTAIEGGPAIPPFGPCMATIMLYFPITTHIGHTIDETVNYLRALSESERMYALCSGLLYNGEGFAKESDSIIDFSNRVENLQISAENRLRILTGGINYKRNLEEVLTLIIPAAKLIEAYSDACDDIIGEFNRIYSAANAKEILEFSLKYKLNPQDSIEVTPTIFGFNKISTNISIQNASGASESSEILTHRILVGIASHLIREEPKNIIPILCEKMKALSDSTRLEILFYLCLHRVYGQELCEKFGLVQSTISYHITKLASAGFLLAENFKGRTYYYADKAGIQRMLDAFAEKIK